MVELTIKVSDKLAEKLLAKEDQLEEIFEIGLRELEPQNSMLYNEVINFFAASPSLKEISLLKPSENAQDRVRELLEKNQAGQLSSDESLELDEIQQLNHMITLLKANAHGRLNE